MWDKVKIMSYRFVAMLLNVDELIVSNYVTVSINNDCRIFWPRRPSSAACKTVLYTADEGPTWPKHPAINC